jgi:hypothetical protein
MCADGDEPSSSPNVLMELVLEIDERGVGARGELKIAKDAAGKERTDALSLETIWVGLAF